MAISSGDIVVQCAYLVEYELDWARKHGTRWYRSKGKVAGDSPFTDYMMNKKWTMEEEFNNHILRFQQVAVKALFM